MSTDLVLFTRDLRVHDQPALATACRSADRIVPVFVFDDAILASRYAAANRLVHLIDAVTDLRANLRARGGELLVRRGDPIAVVRELVERFEVSTVHLSGDLSRYARRREQALVALARERGGRFSLQVHDGVTVVAPGELAPSGGDHFKVFTPYWRRWVEAPRREVLAAPTRVVTPPLDEPGSIPQLAELTDGLPAPRLLAGGGETAARTRMAAWFGTHDAPGHGDGQADGPLQAAATAATAATATAATATDAGGIARYDELRNDLAADATSKLSPALHLGTLSATELAARVDRHRPGHETFLQELCWRDFNHQLLAARPDLVHTDIRTRQDRWRDDEEAFEAWQQGRTGYPVVDAGMRQLAQEGFMHNRARMIVASFLTKHLYLDWRVGAWHFMDHLVDGDLANNFGQWQWTAGTGTDSRPNRMFNPVTQGERYDPTGAYVRRYVPELGEVDDRHLHAPWQAAGSLFTAPGYPPPIVDHREARARFLEARGA